MHYGIMISYNRTQKVFFLMSLNFRNSSPSACQNVQTSVRLRYFGETLSMETFLQLLLTIGYHKLASLVSCTVPLSWQEKLYGPKLGILQAQWMHRGILCFEFLQVVHKNVSFFHVFMSA